jgi:arylsulfatase A-like enzyme
MDIGPTVLELAGLTPSSSMEAQSLLPALAGDPWQGREAVFAEATYAGDGFQTMLRTREWKLVHFVDQPFGQLFELQNDPNEINNLWDNPAYAAIKQELLHQLLNWRIRSSCRTRQWANEYR